jgi:translin
VDRGPEIAAVGERARAALDAKHAARETTLGACRQTIQACAAAIRAVQREEFDAAETLIAEAAGHVARADAAVEGHPDVRHGGYLHDAKKEFAEANLTLAFVRGDVLPVPEAIGVELPAYLNGMAEAASELRRHTLDCLRADRVPRAEELLGVMDEVYALLVTVDYPDAVTGGLRRTTDALRAVIERTRGDLTNALVAQRLREAIDRVDPTPG